MISHKYKCIFIHVPKCAGTSIEKVLGHHKEYDGRGKQDHRGIRRIQRPRISKDFQFNRENINELFKSLLQKNKNINPRNNYFLSSEEFKTYYKFSIVRNPWARIFSWYQNIEKDKLHKKNYTYLNFKDFLFKNVGKGVLRPQLFWLKDFSGRVNLDFIGKFENLVEDTNFAFGNLGLNEVSLPHLLKSSSKNYKDYYDSESIELVSEYYAEEISLFNYTF